MSTAVQERLTVIWESPHTLWGWLATVDHKKVGRRYLVTAFIFLIVGGLEALLIRLQLARSNQSLVDPETYDQIFTMHGMTMIFWYAAPILSGFANYLIPLMIGARDMAFPRLNAFSYWTFLFSGFLLYGSTLIGQVAARQAGSPMCRLRDITYSPGLRHGFLRACSDLPDHLDHRRRNQFHCHHLPPARARHDRSAACRCSCTAR